MNVKLTARTRQRGAATGSAAASGRRCLRQRLQIIPIPLCRWRGSEPGWLVPDPVSASLATVLAKEKTWRTLATLALSSAPYKQPHISQRCEQECGGLGNGTHSNNRRRRPSPRILLLEVYSCPSTQSTMPHMNPDPCGHLAILFAVILWAVTRLIGGL